MCLSDLTLTYDKELFPDTLKMKSSLYLWIIMLMGVFYTLPVAQLLVANQVRAQNCSAANEGLPKVPPEARKADDYQ